MIKNQDNNSNRQNILKFRRKKKKQEKNQKKRKKKKEKNCCLSIYLIYSALLDVRFSKATTRRHRGDSSMAARSGAYTSGKSFNSKFVVARSLQEKAAGIVIIIIIIFFFFCYFLSLLSTTNCNRPLLMKLLFVACIVD